MRDEFIKKTTGMMAHMVDDLCADFTLLGVKIREEVKKVILSKGGAWASACFLFIEKNEKKLMLANFKSIDGIYKRYNYFIVKDKEQARKIYDLIGEWINESS